MTTPAPDAPSAEAARTSSASPLRVLGAAIAVAAVVALVVVVMGGLGDDAAVAGGDPVAGEDLEPPALGDEDAPVTMVEFSDFRCPFCERYATETKPRLVEGYVEEGLVRYEWRDLPLQGNESELAALAGRAAQEQGAFWEFHEALFARADQAYDRELLRDIADDLGLDVDQFDDAIDSGRHVGAVRDDLDLAQQHGLTGTPAFLIDGEPLVGAQPIEVFEEALEGALATAGQDGGTEE